MRPDDKVEIIDADLDAVARHGMCGYRDPEGPGFRHKLAWLKRRVREGMKIKLLLSAEGGTVGSIEYLPGEKAWRGIRAEGYLVIHCLFILKKAFKGKGYGSKLVEACEKDARREKMQGVAVVASKSTWMAKQELFRRRGYELVEEAPPHYQLLVRRFRAGAPLPAFCGDWQEKLARYEEGLTIIHSAQCPYVAKTMDEIPRIARDEFGVEPTLMELSTCRRAQDSPNPYGIFSVIWNGELVADHPISATRFRSIMNKALK